MRVKGTKQILLWSVVLILVGVLALVNQYVELSPWVWAGCLAAAGLVGLGLFLLDTSDWLVLLAAYVILAVAFLIGLVATEILQDEAVAFYVLVAIALPFLGVYLRNRAMWWALIPAYTMLAVVGIIVLAEMAGASDNLVTTYVMFAIALPFFFVYARNRSQWWFLIPAGILSAIGVGFVLAEVAGASDNLITACVMLALAVPFFIVFARNRSQWWFLIPGGILAVIGIGFLLTEAAAAIVAAVLLIAVGVWSLLRLVARKEPPGNPE